MNTAAPIHSDQRLWTYTQLCSKMDETNQPVELWHGHLVMAPCPFIPRQIVAARLNEALRHWVGRHRLGLVIPAPMDVVLGPRLMVQPDLLFIAKERKRI